MKNSIETKGLMPLVEDLSIRIDFYDKSFALHLWRPDTKSYGRLGMGFNHPQAIREYALGLLDMADRFEKEVRSEWEERGGKWIENKNEGKDTP